MPTELIHLAAPTPNAERHAALVLAWELSHTSPNTRRAYGRDLAQYLEWLDGMDADALAVKRPMIDAYRHQLTGAASTVARKLSALSSFYSYAISAGALDGSPVTLVKRPKVDADSSTTSGLTADQARALMAAAREDGPRSAALIALLLTSGVRIGEALAANVTDIGFDSGHQVLIITRKGGKRAKVVLAAASIAALRDYLGRTGSEVAISDGQPAPIFATATGQRWAASEAYRTVRRLAARAGVEGKISPHSLRHTFATLYLGAGGTLHDLQDSMGHADPRTTRRYDRDRNNLARSATHKVAAELAL